MAILSIILFLIAGGCFFISKKVDEKEFKNGCMFTSGISAGIALFFFIWSTFYIVSPGHTGVEILFGKVVNYAPSGMHGKNPFAGVIKMDLRTQKYEVKLASASKDLQEIDVELAINYRLDYTKISELYNTVGVDYEIKVIEPAVINLTKAAVSQFPIADVIIRRNDLTQTIHKSVNERLAQYFIVLETVNLNNITFAKAFSAAVEQKQIQEQNVQTAEYARQQAVKDKERSILEAQAESEKQRLLRNTTSKEVVDLKWIEKWDGKLPEYMMGNSAVMMVAPKGN